MVARTLRHEVGDLLQTVYSAVAILKSRLPAEAEPERRLLCELHAQAEACKLKLDAIQDLACPLTLRRAPANVADIAAGLVGRLGPRFPQVRLSLEAARTPPVLADGPRLDQVGRLLLLNALQAARREVRVRVGPAAGGRVEWAVWDDGPGANAEQLSWLDEPFTTTHFAQFGLGLALARRIAELHGGEFTAANLPEGGFRAALALPAAGP
jgi:signal transduction histidine kinase